MISVFWFFFFFQAEDGIRDKLVTGVQTCALPIFTKWHTVVNSAGAQLSFAASAQCYTSGLFGALFLPSIIGGDVARLAVGISHSPRPAAVITGNVADRFLDVAAQLTLISLGLMLLPGSLPAPLQAPARRVLTAGLLAAVVLFSMVLVLSRPLLRG